MPPSITLEQAAGFGFFMLRAVLSGETRSKTWQRSISGASRRPLPDPFVFPCAGPVVGVVGGHRERRPALVFG